jgi:hypothetical protein
LRCNTGELSTFEPFEFAGTSWLGSNQPNVNITFNSNGPNICSNPAFISYPGTKVYSANIEGKEVFLVNPQSEDRVINPIIEAVSIQRFNDPSRDLYDCLDDDPPPGGIGSLVPPNLKPPGEETREWAAIIKYEAARINAPQSDPNFSTFIGVMTTSTSINTSMLPFDIPVTGSSNFGGGGGSVYACSPGDLEAVIFIPGGFQEFSFNLKGKDNNCNPNTQGRSTFSLLNGNTYWACEPSSGTLNYSYSSVPPDPAFCITVQAFNPPPPIILEAWVLATNAPTHIREWYRIV